MASGEGNVSGQFCFPQGAGAVGKGKHSEASSGLFDRDVLAKTADVEFHFYACLYRIFSTKHPERVTLSDCNTS